MVAKCERRPRPVKSKCRFLLVRFLAISPVICFEQLLALSLVRLSAENLSNFPPHMKIPLQRTIVVVDSKCRRPALVRPAALDFLSGGIGVQPCKD